VKRLAGMLCLMFTLLAGGTASAATEVGSKCEAGSLLIVGHEGMVFPLEYGSSGALPVSTPVSGVATSWTSRSKSTDAFSQRLKVLRLAPDGSTVGVTAETETQEVKKGSGPFPIRIPVQAGDRFGLNSPNGGAVTCQTGNPNDVLGTTLTDAQPGQNEEFFPVTGSQLALSVTVEPDTDSDGYGDETQDGCPEVATVQLPCPRVEVTSKATVKERAILVQVAVSSPASVQVFGQVSWKVRQTRGADAPRDRGLTVGLSAGPTRVVQSTAVFRVPLGKSVKRRLGRLGPRQALRVKLNARVTDLAGRITERPFRVRLPGRG
jgi:hypothetical protein